MHVYSILVISLTFIDCKLLIRDVTFNLHKIVTLNSSIGTTPDGFSSLSINLTISEKTSNDIEIKAVLAEKTKGRVQPLMPIPPFNYCRMRQVGDQFSWVKRVFDELKRFGNVTQNCPIEKGYYYLKDGFMNDTGLGLGNFMKVHHPYVLSVLAKDVTRRKRPIFYFKMVLVVSYEE